MPGEPKPETGKIGPMSSKAGIRGEAGMNPGPLAVFLPLPPPSLGPTGVVQLPMMYLLGMLASTMESFSGKDAARYLEKLEQRAKLDDWTKEKTLKLLKFKCVGEPHSYIRLDSSLDALTYLVLRKKLMAKLTPIRLPGKNQLNLSRCFQGS